LRLGSIAGIDIAVDWSLRIIFLLVTLSLGAGVFPAWHPDWSAALFWSTAASGAPARRIGLPATTAQKPP
jgi:hypothetical protein